MILLLSLLKGVHHFGGKAVLLVTDGHSSFNRHLTILKAEVLKKDGVSIYVIAVRTAFMSGIDEPPHHYLFQVSDLSGWVEVIKLVVKQVAPGKYNIINRQPNKPCSYHG